MALRISGLAKSFGGAPVLRDVNFTVQDTSLVAILGASGSGKTTLLRLIAGFEAPDAGEIFLGGELIASVKKFVKPERRGVGYVAQEGALFPHLSVADNVTFGLSRAARRARYRVAELLAMVDLPSSYADRAPQALSGGEQQRVALARALAPNPKFLLLDEPFSALDVGLREETRLVVAAAIKAAGAAAILVTHDQAEALSMGAEVGVLRDGVLKQMSPPKFLYRHPADADLANFIGEAVFCPGVAGPGTVDCALGTLRLAADAPRGPVEVMVRPEQIKLLALRTVGSVPAVITDVIFYGHDAVVSLALTGPGLATTKQPILARVFSQQAPAVGQAVGLAVDGEVVAFASALAGAGA